MTITRLKVEGLFGLYDYDIVFSRLGEDFTVLTSPNGYGKTTVLRIINSLNVKRLFSLYVLSFKSLSFWFDNGTVLSIAEQNDNEIEASNSDLKKNQRRGLSMSWFASDKELGHLDYQPESIRQAKQIVVRNYRHFDNDLSEENVAVFTNGEIGEAFNSELARMQGQEQFLLQLATVQTGFISANRIYQASQRDRFQRTRPDKPVLRVVYELKGMLAERVREFQNNFQRLDSKLIEMLLGGNGHNISEEEYKKKADGLTALMDELTSFGLTNRQSLPVYHQENAKILDVYLTLMEEKLSYYNDLLPLMRLFDKNVKQKHFANKTIKLSPQHGLRIESDNGDILSADLLSTGEQNQLVLLYDLIFKTAPGSILLIDEPESSLHVAWQNDFVSDMLTIAGIKSLQIIVATHSPIIVSNTPRDRVFDLFYLQKGNYAK